MTRSLRARPPVRLYGALLGLLLALAVPAGAEANNLFTLDPGADTPGPLATDSAGNGYVAWVHGEGGIETVRFCKIPQGGTCTSPITLPIPVGGEAPKEPYAVLGSQPNVVYVVGTDYATNQVLIWTSTSAGAGFGEAKVVAGGGGRTGLGAVLLNPAHLATSAKPTSDRFALAPFHVGISYSESGNEAATKQEVEFAGGGVFAADATLAFTASNLPVEAFWNDGKVDEVIYYANKGPSTLVEPDWEGPFVEWDGYHPHLEGGRDGVFMLSADYLGGESTAGYPDVLEVRHFDEGTRRFEAPVVVARAAGALQNGDGAFFEDPGTGTLYVAWPEQVGSENVMKLWESSDGGHSFHGERDIAVIAGDYKGYANISVDGEGHGYLTWRDEAGLRVADLNSVPAVPPETVVVTPTPTSTTGTQSGAGSSGSSITVPQGAPVTLTAHVAGASAASASGTVTYALYKNKTCTLAAAPASTAAIVNGLAGASAPVKLAPGTYYWQISYSGNSTNVGSTGACGAEVLTVAAVDHSLGLPSTKICLSRRHFVVHPRAPKHVRLVSVEILINGKLAKKAALSKRATEVSLVGLPKGTFKVALITRSSKGRSYEDIRTYHTCVPKKSSHKR